MRKVRYVWIVLISVTLALAGTIQLRWQRDLENAKVHYTTQYHAEALRYLDHIDVSINTIYQNLRTLASLPSLWTIDRNAKNISEEARTTFQLIYNNLADAVAVSEVYVLPINFDPEKIDPSTGKAEEPIIAFDQLIVNAGSSLSRVTRQSHSAGTGDPAYTGPPEIETFEYRQMVNQLAWFKEHFPTRASFEGLNVPFISGAEVLLCDNTQFIKSSDDKDRSGVIFSVPFYDAQGEIKGMVSAMVLTNALRDMLPTPSMALVNPENGFAIMGAAVARLDKSEIFIKSAAPDPQLIYSEALQLSTKEARSPWKIWVGNSRADFESSAEVAVAKNNRLQGFIILTLLTMAAAICVLLAQRNLKIAHDSAEKLQALNNDISTLNSDLAGKLTLLSEAQDAIVKSGRMAQLGQLVATVAHEIRNPLGSIRTTSFTLKRRLESEKIDYSTYIERINTGIKRCDHIINQLLDFSRVNALQLEDTDLCQWLQGVLEEEVSLYPSAVRLELVLPEENLRASIDAERLRRCVINMVSNASEALTHSPSPTPNPMVLITVAKSARGIEIIFQDNGPGISVDIIAKISEPLFTTKSFGTGLGIAATRKVAELHGGGLDISSELGKGARFIVWFPDRVNTLKAA